MASGLTFAPLYYLAGDYGRWLNFHVSSLVFLTLIFLLKRRPDWLYEHPRRLDFIVLLAMSFVVGVAHVSGELIDGSLVKVVRAIHGAMT
jgi:hypothetical protein